VLSFIVRFQNIKYGIKFMSDPMTIVSSALASFNHANNLIKAIFELKVDSATIDKVTAIQSELASVQNGYLALIQQNTSLVTEKDDLKKQIAELETWETERQRYELQNVAPEVCAYVIKESARGSEPLHWLCCKCYNESKKGIFNLFSEYASGKTYRCTICNSDLHVPNQNPPRVNYDRHRNWRTA